VPYTAANGWGSYEQIQNEQNFIAKLHVAYGFLRLNKIALAPSIFVTKAKVQVGNKIFDGKFVKQDQVYHFEFDKTVELKKGQILEVNLS
jgi:hypothetical protein